MNRLEDEIYMVRADDTHFVLNVDGRTIEGVTVPSAALRLSYLRADAACQSLRRRGYRQAVVCGVTGCPVTLAELRGEARPRAPADDLPQTKADVHRVRAAEFKKRWINDAAFRQRVEQIEQ
jgi:hypothetical protein